MKLKFAIFILSNEFEEIEFCVELTKSLKTISFFLMKANVNCDELEQLFLLLSNIEKY